MLFILFVYGLALFAMGAILLAWPRQGSTLPLGRALRGLGVFGLLHGCHEWLDGWALLDPDVGGARDAANTAALATSFIALAWFGGQLTAAARPRWAVVARAAPIALCGLFVLAALADLAPTLDAAARSVLGLPAASMAAIGTWLQVPPVGEHSPPWRSSGAARFGDPAFAARSLAVVLAVYGVLVGVVVDAAGAPFGPSSRAQFAQVAGVPVELLQTACAVGMTVAALRLLSVFGVDSLMALERRVAERTAELEQATARLVEEVEERNAAEAVLVAMVDMAPDAQAMLDGELRYLHVNRRYAALHPRADSGAALVGQHCYRALFGRDDPCERCPAVEAMNARAVVLREQPTTAGGVASDREWTRITSIPLIDGDGAARRALLQLKDITEERSKAASLQRHMDEIEALSRTDALTGLLNRRAVLERLADEVARVQRYGSTCVLLVVDLDRFKVINDSHGHAAGDAVLERFGRILTQAVRTTDWVGRLGGDEFLLVLPQTGNDGGQMLAERIQRTLSSEEFRFGGAAPIRAAASIGIAEIGAQGAPSVQQAIEAADRAMYLAKRSGGGCARVAQVLASGVVAKG